MMPAEARDEVLALDATRECLYRYLAAALSDPWAANWDLLFEAASQELVRGAADLLREEASRAAVSVGFGELPPEHLDAKPLLAGLPGSDSQLRSEYTRVFGLLSCRECPPYETEYHPASETFYRAQQLADIAGFYRAFGIAPSRIRPERPDHIALELDFMAFLHMKKRLALASTSERVDAEERAQVCHEGQRSFFRDHLAWWVPSFATGLRRKAGTGFYAAAAGLLAALLPLERGRLGVDAPRLPLQPTLIERPEERAGCAGCAASA
jgi:TorA maturation chaperone TorD